MGNDFYTAEQVAELLGLHVRTVRNYIQDGRLPAVRIGKQYRITPAGLASLTGGDAPADRPDVHVTSIVTVDTIDRQTASRLATSLQASAMGRGNAGTRLRIDTAYDDTASTCKIVVIGDALDTAEVLRLVDAFVEGTR
ncbi:helix-turn-helix domain-containing protein [Rhodococcus sp. BP-252]|uniref:Helix-turn-helix domain-containing protein n=1 Tax=Rhodococcoides kyotonense TaxID=398843 RepID=A0A177YKC9_9NOCA|nr:MULTISPECIES: helix-turn-helix domain-containing protein [Rhodococcus]MBY6413744.1 helix-turn-helix domain-containing protein [Rhodococcus sp. BP-320]MBY6418475.1 helix-turn-helix domain-containing protein [Rhodococcus sp. BP-321]MBY6422600.1 helix-turn-helix domain-containing protein [Rhodococcus sp. BP-324]MBY6428383.1 helix-turn-helix domain-containing protein [Rhodococcus sp. BP-323]MBY6433560.1 helix-turn-helix domain-containing protein [Rhodococcus sp. BP-322]